jgi:carboxypeptidase Q
MGLKNNVMWRNSMAIVASLVMYCSFLQGQTMVGKDEAVLKRLYQEELLRGKAYMNLRSLCKEIGSRLSGSKEAEEAVAWAKALMESMKIDTVYLQEVMVPHWVRGDKAYAKFNFSGYEKEVPVSALGGSVGTKPEGITAEVVEIHNLDELEQLGRAKLENKIVFYNRPMEAEHIQTFQAYSNCVDQRYKGAAEASKYGVVATLVRSMNLRLDNHPHTGAQQYADGFEPIPTAAISTNSAELLSKALQEDPRLTFHLNLNCQTLPDVLSYNVIGEITGTTYPEEIVVVGGHLDSWDVGEGAHDDGAGVVHSIAVLQLFKSLDIRPKRTVRCVLFMNEENGLRGGVKYAEEAKRRNEHHLAAIESDAGGFTPRGFGVAGVDSVQQKCLSAMEKWKPLFAPYLVHYFEKGHGGADINQLKSQGTALIGFVPDSQRYFDYHHAENDVFEAVNKRELELGAATMAALAYLLSEYGLE